MSEFVCVEGDLLSLGQCAGGTQIGHSPSVAGGCSPSHRTSQYLSGDEPVDTHTAVIICI